MIKPYYCQDGITIYHGDSREILGGGQLSAIGLIVTDPPYGMSYCSNRSPKHLHLGGIQGDQSYPEWIFYELTYRVGMCVFCRWDNLQTIPPPKSFIVWDKGVHSMGDLKHEFGRQWEGVAFYPGPEHEFTKRPSDVIRASRVTPGDMQHPTQKPIECITPLILCHPVGMILDPFMGSGTTLEAAKLTGRPAIGIEIEERFCEIAARRLSQGNLFGMEAA